MCTLVEDYAKEYAEKCVKNSVNENNKGIALDLLRLGKLTLSEICLSTKLSIETLKQLATENNITYIQ